MVNKALRIIFLDVDDVLNSHSYLSDAGSPDRGIYAEIDKTKVSLLRQLVDETGAKIVLSSSWRIMLSDTLEPRDVMTRNLLAVLHQHGLALFDKTIDLEEQRETEILEWLNLHPEVDTFVILDDDVSLGWDMLVPYWVKTSYSVGLTQSEIRQAVAILNRV